MYICAIVLSGRNRSFSDARGKHGYTPWKNDNDDGHSKKETSESQTLPRTTPNGKGFETSHNKEMNSSSSVRQRQR